MTNTLNNVLWVNRLPKDMTETDIGTYFGSYGSIVKTTVCSSKQRPTSYCFVEYEDENFDHGVLTTEYVLDNVRIQVEMADKKLYDRCVKRLENRYRLEHTIHNKIQDMSVSDAYYYGFSQGKKYMIKNLSGNQSVKYNRSPTEHVQTRY